MDTSHGLLQFWSQGDTLTRLVALALLAMSLASWTVIILKLIDLRRYRRHAQGSDGFWFCTDFDSALASLGPEPDNAFRELALQGRAAAGHLNRGPSSSGVASGAAAATQLQDALDPSEWVSRALRHSIDDSQARWQSGLALLASVGSTAPFVGLFGTVWGIYHALLGIGSAGQASIAEVAGPIGEALVMTALGLAVAIPAVLGYNALLRANKGLLHRLNRFAHDLHAYLLTGARVNGQPARAPAPH